MLYLCGALFGLGFGGFGAVQSPLTAEFFGLRAHGAIFSLFMFAQNIGGAAGPLAAGSIFDISGNYQWAFVLCTILSVAGLILSMLPLLKNPLDIFEIDQSEVGRGPPHFSLYLKRCMTSLIMASRVVRGSLPLSTR
jgi:MFS family permease